MFIENLHFYKKNIRGINGIKKEERKSLCERKKGGRKLERALEREKDRKRERVRNRES